MNKADTLSVLAAGAEPITPTELRNFVHTNDTSEDLTNFIAAGRKEFEHRTGRACTTTTFRQHFYTLEDVITCQRGPTTSIVGLSYYDVDGDLQPATVRQDLTGPTGRVWMAVYPATDPEAEPVGYLDYVAGTDTCPADIKLAVCKLAASHFERRDGLTKENLKEDVALSALIDRFRTGQGEW